MSRFCFSFLSSTEVFKVEVGAKKTVQEIKRLIEEQYRLSPGSIDIVSEVYGFTHEDDESLDITKEFKIVQHPNTRTIPTCMRTISLDITDPDETDPRVLLSCGHAMAADTLYRNITVQLKDGKNVLRCFKCNKEWDFQDTAGKAQMSTDEKFFWGNKMSLNSVGDECPKCGYYCQRIAEENDRAECMRCIRAGTFFEFCWKCKSQWTTDHRCKSKEDIQNMLQNCKTKEIEYSNIPNVPTIRLCPSCGALIEHIDMCKEMKCYRCEESFCFVCLTMCKDGRLGCSRFDAKCPVAPVQIV